MNNHIEFLNYIYQNAQMGVVGIKDIITKVENEKFEKLLNEQKADYQNICDETIEILKKYGKEQKELNKMAKISSYMMTQMKTMSDSSTSNLAKMMMEGSNKGIIEITEKLNNFAEEDEEIVALANKLLETEQNNLDNLKQFL